MFIDVGYVRRACSNHVGDQHGEEASFLMKTRLIPTMKACKPIVEQLGDHNSINRLEVNLKGSSLIVVGSSSPSRLQSKPVRWLFLDEVRNYP